MNKEIFKLAGPNIISNISVPLLSTVDVALMGHLSVVHLGAIGLATMIFNFFYWNFGFLRMGTTGLVAQAYGADDQSAIREYLSKGVFLAIGLAVLIIICQYPIGLFSSWVLGIGSDHHELVWSYFNIRIWSAPATLLTYCLFGWFFGMQNTIVPMCVTILVNLLNITLSYYLVVVQGLDIQGVALGTIIAEYVGLAVLFAILLIRYKMKRINIPSLDGLTRFFTINRDLFIRTVALTSAFAFFYRQSALSSELLLAVNVVLLQFLAWMSYGIDGLAYASESLVGKYKGRKDSAALTQVVKSSFIWGSVMAICISLLFASTSENIASLLTSDASVLEAIRDYNIWLVAMPLLAFTCYIWDGIFIGLTQTSMMRDSMILSLGLYILSYFLLRSLYPNAIWVSFAIFLGLRGVIMTIYWFAHTSVITE